MSEGLRKKLVYATLPAALIWAWFSLSSSEKPTSYPAPHAAASVTAPVAVTQPTATKPSAVTVTHQIDYEARRTDRWGLDPFRSYLYDRKPHTQRKSTLSWVLGGIIYNHQRPMAFVNNRPVKVGDQINQATVIAIDRETVTLEYQGRQIKLKVDKG